MCIEEQQECIHCKSTKHIIENRRDGEIVCTNCGTVQTTFLLVHDDQDSVHNHKNKKARTNK